MKKREWKYMIELANWHQFEGEGSQGGSGIESGPDKAIWIGLREEDEREWGAAQGGHTGEDVEVHYAEGFREGPDGEIQSKELV